MRTSGDLWTDDAPAVVSAAQNFSEWVIRNGRSGWWLHDLSLSPDGRTLLLLWEHPSDGRTRVQCIDVDATLER